MLIQPSDYRRDWSPPVRGRGLKLDMIVQGLNPGKSPPVRGRGLKLCDEHIRDTGCGVAPRAGAWIETS